MCDCISEKVIIIWIGAQELRSRSLLWSYLTVGGGVGLAAGEQVWAAPTAAGGGGLSPTGHPTGKADQFWPVQEGLSLDWGTLPAVELDVGEAGQGSAAGTDEVSGREFLFLHFPQWLLIVYSCLPAILQYSCNNLCKTRKSEFRRLAPSNWSNV